MIFGNSELKKQVARLEEQNRIMRTTLEFYADTKNWQLGHKYRDEDDATIVMDRSESNITVDKGGKASRALELCNTPKLSGS